MENRETEIEHQLHGHCYSTSASNQYPAVTFDIEDDDEVVLIGSRVRIASNSSISSSGKPSFARKKVIIADDYDVGADAEGDEIEWIISTEVEQRPRNIANHPLKNGLNIETEVNNCNYSLQIEPRNERNVIDVEQEYLSESDRWYNSKRTHFVGCYDVEDDIESVNAVPSSSPPEKSSTIVVNAMVHSNASPSPSPSVVMHDESIQESEIDEYDAKMRACFGLDFSFSSLEAETSAGELNASTGDISTNNEEMQCDSDNGEVIYIEEGDSEDDCVITAVENCAHRSKIERNSSFTKNIPDIGFKKRDKPKKEIITETVDEIFRRMMPLSVPGALSLFAPDRNCLPQNVRPSKFCYYYFVSSHIVVKEIIKQEFFKFKEQILASKRSNAPPRCGCISHPLNQNASKLTLLTNPYSLYHKPNCHFSQNSKNSTIKRKGPRRLTSQVSFHRIPQRREDKDFKDWSDIVLRRRQKAADNGNLSSVNWSCEAEEKPDLAPNQSFVLKSEPIDSNDLITIKTEY